MSFLFKRNKHKNARDGLELGIRPAPSTGDHTPTKLRKNIRRHSFRRAPASTAAKLSRSKSAGHLSGNGGQATGMASIVPHQYAEMLLQASAARDHQQQYGLYRRSTPPPDADYANATELEVPPPTPFHQDTRRRMSLREQQQQPPGSQVLRALGHCNITVDAIVEGVTYDAILASTVNKTLGMAQNQGRMVMQKDGTVAEASMPPPEPRVPPNSPAATVHQRRRRGRRGGEGGFGSLMGLTMAIMESRAPAMDV